MVTGDKRTESALDVEDMLAGREEECCCLQMLVDQRKWNTAIWPEDVQVSR